MDALYPALKPYRRGYLDVSVQPPHKIYYEEHGDRDGAPVFVLHGGPGAPVGEDAARFFDPDRYRIVIAHQRGTGKSQPFLSLQANTTRDLVNDITALKAHLGITGKIHLFGGSWGSFLALVYAIENSGSVASLVLRGIFLGNREQLYDSYQRDAEREDHALQGAGRFFPEEWRRFIEFIPVDERENLLKAYYRRMHDKDAFDRAMQWEAAWQWYTWEDAIIRLHPHGRDERDKDKTNRDSVLSNALLETHYFYHGCFLNPFPGGDNHILTSCDALAPVPIAIIQGRYDMATPRNAADQLVNALNTAKMRQGKNEVSYTITTAGHTMNDEENAQALVRATDAFAVL
jgi:proline iminopeptidase